ncbi:MULTISPECIES: cytochrome c maturation protein CcmE [unclassified Sphingomonas]|uniref:cytochrome c maturation protein CcmE n=1 Tax=unclassified Sphingomonas TaxID=196159 RepID=UPI0006FF6580|nr:MULTISPECIES: cytochrome c maturation protein CcmE [unclassified Sphingomonas]KQM66882.1 cytochrome C biogenesis protein CcmE [Sphingomonas sp. Leaf16]KQN17829.1 cytochrome C biogenesis protein CcmE [Sphingomonas sp. Leaf29]KQN23692.1 cytochrome C biogenesis protein CcmE [Sphingomonas sp. Leaf32]
MSPKRQRMTLALLAVVAIVGAVLLAMSALGDEAAFFYAPADAASAPTGKPVRLGGMVAAGSVRRAPDGVTIRFTVTDGKASVPVRFAGIVPDLFREGSGVVAEGRFVPGGGFVADNLLAKHDERYMPPQVAGKMHKSESIAK